MRTQGLGSRSELSRRARVAAEEAHRLGLRPGNDTIAKIVSPQELLARGLGVTEASRPLKRLEGSGLGWKNYYRYAPLVYTGPRIPAPIEKSFTRDYTGILDVEGLRTAVNEVAKHAAHRVMLERRAQRRDGDYGKEWPQLCRDLIKTWIHEVAIELIGQMS